MREKVEIWYRDPIECIQELIGNPLFRDTMGYAPERVFLDENGTQRAYDEMWTADWWWETQVSTSKWKTCFSGNLHDITKVEVASRSNHRTCDSGL